MTFEEWDDKHWTVKCRDNKHYELEAPGCTYVFNKHDFLQLFRNINAVADNLFEKEVYYIHDDGIYNRETGEQLLGVIDDCEKLNEQDTKIKDLIKENEQLKKELFESEKDYLIETYSDNPIRRDEKIHSLKEEFKERFGGV